MLKLVIFDHDGLMVNSEIVVFSALNDLFKRHNHNFGWDYFVKHIGMSVSEYLEIFYKDFPLAITFDEFYSLRNEIVAKHIEKDLQLMPGLLPLLKTIKNLGIDMAVSTSGKREYIESSLNRFDIADFFTTVVCIEDVTRGKPYPDLLLKCLKNVNVAAKHAVMLEDSPHGIDAANRAGVFSIAVPTKSMDLNKFADAKLILPDLETLNNLFMFLKK